MPYYIYNNLCFLFYFLVSYVFFSCFSNISFNSVLGKKVSLFTVCLKLQFDVFIHLFQSFFKLFLYPHVYSKQRLNKVPVHLESLFDMFGFVVNIAAHAGSSAENMKVAVHVTDGPRTLITIQCLLTVGVFYTQI